VELGINDNDDPQISQIARIYGDGGTANGE